MKRITALLLAAALLLGGCRDVGEHETSDVPTREPSDAPAQETTDMSAREMFFESELDGGYTLSLSLLPGSRYGVGQASRKETEYSLAVRTDYTFPVLLGRESAGEVRLTLFDDGLSGTLYFLESDAEPTVELRVEKSGDFPSASLRKITYGKGGIEQEDGVRAGKSDAETCLYIESDGLFVKTGRSVKLTDMGSTVYWLAPGAEGAEFEMSDGFVLTERIERQDSSLAAVHGALCTAPLVDWSVAYRGQKAVNFDATSENLFLSDGFYYEKPSTYEPCAEAEGRFVYRSAMSSVHRSAAEKDCGAYLRLLGLYLMYTRMESVNDEGFIPNPCASTWLREDYGIGAGFYDTRFNTDAIDALVFADSQVGEPAVYGTAEKALGFYLDFLAEHGFEAAGGVWAPDYLDASGEITNGYCSLNHYLAEGKTLIDAGLLYGREDWVDAGLDIFGTIDASSGMWIRPNGDLWYAITTEGEMIRDDYVSVTYNDLVATVRLLQNDLGVLEDYPGIRALLASKEGWLEANGCGALILTHP